MLAAIRTRLVSEESGFSLIELLTVSCIIGILTSIATPSYLGFKSNAQKTAASANLAAIVPDIEWYAFENIPGAETLRDPDYNGSDAQGTGTNADSGYDDTWSGHSFMSILQAKFDATINPANFTWDPTGWAPSTGLTTATDYCVYTTVGPWYAAKHGPGGAITTGATMHVGSNGDCYAQ
jgi:prepilin-type N-terminal cleavage/methylation domain-containing protein